MPSIGSNGRTEAHDPNLPYIGAARQEFEIVRDHPRFQALLQKMNLPQ